MEDIEKDKLKKIEMLRADMFLLQKEISYLIKQKTDKNVGKRISELRRQYLEAIEKVDRLKKESALREAFFETNCSFYNIVPYDFKSATRH